MVKRARRRAAGSSRPELRATSLQAFLRTSEEVKRQWDRSWDSQMDPWFRGVSDAAYEIIPGAYRIKDPAFDEDDYRDQFQLRAFPYLTSVLVKPSTDWEWYFVMQHYGLPTRLLDWTEAAGVALYFAVRDEKPTDSAVWMLDPFWLNGRVSGGPDYILNITEQLARRYLRRPFSRRPLPDRPIAIQPPFHSYRITAQKGMFTIHGAERRSLESYAAFRDHLVKIVIPRSAVSRIKAQLMTMGITETTVFPELDALGRELLYYLGATSMLPIAQARQAATRGADGDRR